MVEPGDNRIAVRERRELPSILIQSQVIGYRMRFFISNANTSFITFAGSDALIS